MKKLIVSQSGGDTYPKFLKLLIIMKLTAIFLIVVCLQASANGFGQSDISISVKNVELKKLFNMIQKQTTYRFLYEDGQLPKNTKVDLDVTKASIQLVLNRALINTSLRYRILNDNLIVVSAAAKEISSQIVKGRITDEAGQPLPGVSIRAKGSATGVSSGSDGAFVIEVPDKTILEISYVGYLTQEVPVTGDQEQLLDIRMIPADKNMQEVVVVGYGTQKRINLTGAVDGITSKQIENRPLMNLGSGLQGLIPNLNITIPNGRATTAPSFNIRGVTSINGGAPLILVDNIPFTTEEVSRLNPNDVESVNVLKDAASAAIYGARAAFGVILINTKSAKSKKLNVSLNANTAIRTIGKVPELVTDPYIVMLTKHDAAVPLYDLYDDASRAYAKQRSDDPSLPAVIIDPTNPQNWAYFGSTNWLKEAYRNTAPTYNANISLSKKSDNLSYYFSGEYYSQDGLLRYGNDIYKRYNVRGKVDLDVTKWLTFSNNTMLTNATYNAPVFMDDLFFWNVNRTSPLDIPKNPDGSWTFAGADLLGRMQNGGRSETNLTDVQTTFAFKANVIKDLWDIKGDATYRRGSALAQSYDLPVAYKTGPDLPVQYTGVNTSYAQNVNNLTRYNVYNIYTEIHKSFNDHFFQAVAGYNQEYRYEDTATTRRNNLISTGLPSIGLSTGTLTQTERITEWAVQGLFYRLNYSYKDRYLLELNGRYDGSSRFPAKDRWGFFPSASGGWIISDEKFFNPVSEGLKMNLLKLRASYGALGNQASLGAYDYIPVMPNGQIGQLLNGGLPIGVYAPGAVAPRLTWEKVSTINFGADLGFFNNRLEVNFDKYTRYTKDMLVPGKTLPAVFGTASPKENAADLKTSGWELRLNWRDNGELAGSPFYYNVSVSLADSRSKITRFDNPTRTLNDYYKGQEIGEIWGLEFEGFFQNEQELATHADQTPVGTDDQSFQYFVGDIKFKDRNKDGVVDFGDYTADKPGDLFKVGNTSPRLPYSVDLSGGWNGFDLRIFLQGIGKRDWYPGASNIYFWGVYAQPWTNVTRQNLDHWTPENPNGYFPAVRAYAAEDNMSELTIPNKRYMQDASYLRVKNVTLGYSISKNLLKRIKVDKIRVYFSAENIFELSHMKVKLDPEVGLADEPQQRAGTIYPFQRTYSFGLNFNF